MGFLMPTAFAFGLTRLLLAALLLLSTAVLPACSNESSLLSLRQRRDIQKASGSGVYRGALSTDACQFLCPDDKSVKMWNLKTGKLSWSAKKHKRDVSAVTFVPNSTTLVSTDATEIFVWDVRSGKFLRKIEHNGEDIRRLACHPSKPYLGLSTINGPIIIDLAKPQREFALPKKPRCGGRLCFSPDGKLFSFVEGLSKSRLIVWRFPSGKLVLNMKLDEMDVDGLSFDAKSQLLAVCGSHSRRLRVGIVKIYEVQTGKVLASYHKNRIDSFISICFQPMKDRVVFGGADGALTIWEYQTNKQQTVSKVATKPISFVGFSDKGDSLVAASWDGSITIWRVESVSQK